MLHFDHVVVAVRDLEEAAARLRVEHGIATVAGGVHPTGTMNYGNRFSDWSYIELLAVHDSSKDFGALVERFVRRRGDGLFHWAVQTDDIEAVATRVGVSPTAGSVRSPDGQLRGSWRSVSHPDQRRSGAGLPFFIQYDLPPSLAEDPSLEDASPADLLEARKEFARAHGTAITEGGITWVSVGADRTALREWLGETDLDVRCSDDGVGLQAVGVNVEGREVTLT